MSEFYLQLIFMIILCGVFLTLFKYSQEGDIGTFTSDVPNIYQMKNKYTDKNSIAKRLHSLLVYKESYVRWNRFILIAMFSSLVILHFLKSEIKLGEFIILSCFIFLCIDLPNRWGYAHISKGVIQEATQLYTYHDSLEK